MENFIQKSKESKPRSFVNIVLTIIGDFIEKYEFGYSEPSAWHYTALTLMSILKTDSSPIVKQVPYPATN